MPLRLVFMGTPDFAVPTLAEIVGRGHDVAAVYTRAPQARRPRHGSCKPTPVEREARRFGIAGAHAEDACGRRGAEDACSRAHQADAAVVVAYGLILPKPILDAAAARLLQSARLAAAALARRGADQPRDHGRRRRDRRHGDADGGRPRHRPDRDGRARRDRARHDRRRSARRARAARRRPDGARARRRSSAAR